MLVIIMRDEYGYVPLPCGNYYRRRNLRHDVETMYEVWLEVIQQLLELPFCWNVVRYLRQSLYLCQWV